MNYLVMLDFQEVEVKETVFVIVSHSEMVVLQGLHQAMEMDHFRTKMEHNLQNYKYYKYT